ncbi:hepatitis A virus cellular receptor 1-like [Haliotis asinina]|uniref:hepatitis A virus cellular receptor 1-like n=1 Tax=Haliotis asinina TaxID=109174 RepID=UPI0035322489
MLTSKYTGTNGCNAVFLPVLLLHFSLCAASQRSFGATADVVLPGSVFHTFRRTTVQQCRQLCVYSSRCLSISWSSSTRECQLNSKKRNSERLLVSDKNLYLSVQDMTQQDHPCGYQPCSTEHMCIPVNTAKGHVCVRIDASKPQTTAEGITKSASTTATTVATSTQAVSAKTSTAVPTTPKVPTMTSAATTTTTTTTTLPDTNEPERTSPAATTPISTSTTSQETTSPETTTSATSAPSTTTTTTTTPKPYNGTCVTDIDCAVPPGRTCFNGVCICFIGYDMDETNVKCRKLTEYSNGEIVEVGIELFPVKAWAEL